MTPEARKLQSETRLIAAAVPVNPSLPPLAADDDITMRSTDEVLQRLVALWAVVGKAMIGKESGFAAYIVRHKLQAWLSPAERRYILDKRPSARDNVHFSWQLEALYMVAWCAGLLEADEIPASESSIEPIMGLFPLAAELPDRLQAALAIRPKSDIIARADLLHRLHWAVRDGELAGIDAAVVQEWHRALNWMLRHQGENDWDKVGTDT